MTDGDAYQLSLLMAGVLGMLGLAWRLGWQRRDQAARRERQAAGAELAALRGLLQAQRLSAGRTIARHREAWFAAGVLAARHEMGVDGVDGVDRAPAEPGERTGPRTGGLPTPAGALAEVERLLRAAREERQP